MELSENNQLKTWLGTSITDICKGKGPWSFSVTPVTISKCHAVLYNLPVTLTSPPKPHCNFHPQHWDKDHVRMPYSDKNLFPVVENGKDVIKLRWSIIKDTLSKPIKNSRELETAILTYNNSVPRFLALHYFFEEILSEDETEYFFSNLLPKIIKLALQLPEIVPGSFPLLKKNHNRSVSLSQLQIACLLANAFLCTFPWKNDVAGSYPGVNFVRLFAAHIRPEWHICVSEKMKCIVHYFKRVTNRTPVGTVTFERKFVRKANMPRWDACKNNLGNTKIHIDSSGTIEDNGLGFLQVDFANKNVGGGVLAYGCVQEEIRFIICPELIISRLFVEQLEDHEAVVVTGPERYSNYTGYGDTFKWDGNIDDTTPFDEYGRRKTTICIIDATLFHKPPDQFYPSAILRELNKAYVGFASREKENLAPVATGNWGCGAFRGSSELKSLIQLMACSAAGRDLVYFSFGNEILRDEFYKMHLFLANNRLTVVHLWRILCSFATLRLPQEKLFSYIQQAFFDTKKQSTKKKFFGINLKKSGSEGPSTSGENKKANNSNRITNDSKNKRNSKEKRSSEAMEGVEEFDEDIIANTPPEEIASRGKNTKFKFKTPSEDASKKSPISDIAGLFDIMDGNANRPKEKSTDDSFLAEKDKLHKKAKNHKLEKSTSCKVGDERMDTDDSPTTESISVLSSPTTESKSSKRKITDYFQIKSSKSS